MKHELTSLQYLNILNDLPNPEKHFEDVCKGKAQPEYMVAYLPYGKKQTALSMLMWEEGVMSRAHVNQIKFELVANPVECFWQPCEEVFILPVKEGDFKKNWINK
jgi:hypothetical protein